MTVCDENGMKHEFKQIDRVIYCGQEYQVMMEVEKGYVVVFHQGDGESCEIVDDRKVLRHVAVTIWVNGSVDSVPTIKTVIADDRIEDDDKDEDDDEDEDDGEDEYEDEDEEDDDEEDGEDEDDGEDENDDEDEYDKDDEYGDDTCDGEDYFGRQLALRDEEGNEVVYTVVDCCVLGWRKYLLIFSDERMERAVAEVIRGVFLLVEDEEIIACVDKCFAAGMYEMEDVPEADDYDDVDDRVQNSGGSDGAAQVRACGQDGEFQASDYFRQTRGELFTEAEKAYLARNYIQAMKLYEEALSQGNFYAAAHIGLMFHKGVGYSKDDAKAFEYFRVGADCGCPLAGVWMSYCYRTGMGVEKDVDKAKRIYEKYLPGLKEMSRCGDRSAQYFLGYDYLLGLVDGATEEEGVRLLKLALQKGYEHAAVVLADCYYYGQGVPEDPRMTIRLLAKYPAPDSPKAHYLLARCWISGDGGVDIDLERAFYHFKEAALLGHGISKQMLAYCYFYGVGTEINYSEAVKWYREAADQSWDDHEALARIAAYAAGAEAPPQEQA